MKLLILEDESVAARRLERLTRGILGDAIARVAVANSLEKARSILNHEPFDLILLDLNLSGENGFELFTTELGRAHVVIVSAYPDRAIEAFGHAALDFVPKPVNAERLRQALERFRDALARPTSERLVVRAAGRADVVDLDTIVRIEGADDYSELLLDGGRKILVERRLNALEGTLPSAFVRVHRSYLVNLHHTLALEQSGGRATLRQTGGVCTPISRRKLAALKQRMRALFGSVGA